MADDNFSAFMLMSSEKDIVDSISNERILNRFADSSSSLRKHLVPS